jgi:hypothetical protein
MLFTETIPGKMLRYLMLRQAVHIITSFVYVVMNHLTKGGKFFGLRAF